MNHLILHFILIVFFSNSLFSQENIITVFEDEAYNIKFDSLYLPIHKVTKYDKTLWVSDYGGGNVYKSIDTGKSFNKIATLGAEYFESIQFIDQETGFISGDYGYVYKTIDGGKTWVEISPEINGRIIERFRNDSTKNQKPDGLFAAYYSMHFISDSIGYVSGYMYNPMQGFRKSYERLFFLTKDGGSYWEKPSVEEQRLIKKQFKDRLQKQNVSFENEYFLNKHVSWKVGKNKDKSDIIIKTDYNSNNNDTLTLPKTDFNRIMLRNITFLNAKIGFIFGGSLDKENELAVVYKTTDSGKSWDYVELNISHIHAAITDENYLYLFGKNKLAKRIKKNDLIKIN